MTWQLTEDVEEFRSAADRCLARDAARHTVLLTVSEGVRGQGYAAGATAAVSRAAVETGAEQVLLFTDPANRTSNALYRRLGYRAVAEYAVLEFDEA